MRRLEFALAVVLLTWQAASSAANVTVFAAASLTDSLKEIAAAYEKETGDKILLNFAASSFLERQIEEGAPADIFFSADEAKMNNLEKAGLIMARTRKSRLSNSLVIVVPNDSTLKISSAEDLAQSKVNRIALADPKTVPAGIYGKDYLQKAKVWGRVESKVVPVDNVRAALAAVESGNVEVAIVFRTDARISAKVKLAFQVPASETPSISYPVAIVKGTGNVEAAQRFLERLNSGAADRVFEKFGFIIRK